MNEKQKSTRKAKAEAKKLLTGFINDIALEDSDITRISGEEIGDVEFMSKAEALARYIWKAAQGYREIVVAVDSKTGERTERTVIHAPDKAYVIMLYDRMEGKAANTEAVVDDSKPTVGDRVSEQAKNRLNKLTGKK